MHVCVCGVCVRACVCVCVIHKWTATRKSSGPQTSVEGVEGEEGGPMIRRHATCMLTCNKLSRYRKRVHNRNYTRNMHVEIFTGIHP